MYPIPTSCSSTGTCLGFHFRHSQPMIVVCDNPRLYTTSCTTVLDHAALHATCCCARLIQRKHEEGILRPDAEKSSCNLRRVMRC